MPTIHFSYHPAYITLSDGMRVAARYWRASWPLWILPVIAIVLVNGLTAVVFGSSALDARSLGISGSFTRPYTMAAITPALIAGPIATALVSLVAGWFITAVAVAGLRGRPITPAWVISAGLGTIGAAIIGGGAAVAVILALAVATAISPILLLSLFFIVPAGIYIGLRLTFWTLAIYDGFGVMGGARFSWLITKGSTLRLLGWGLAVAAVSLGIILLAALASLFLAMTGSMTPANILATGVTAVFEVFSLILMAVLYESQRWRYAPPAMPAAPVQPDEYRSPLDPPPPPPPPAGSWG